MSEEYSSSFIPDDLDEYQPMDADDINIDLEEEAAFAELEAEQAAMEARITGQSAPRKLDFASYGITPNESVPPPPSLGSLSATQRALNNNNTQQPSNTQSLSLGFDDDDIDLTRDLPSVGTGGVAAKPAESSSAAPSVLPPLNRAISDLRAKVHTDRLYVYRRAPVVGGSISVTNAKGERVYVAMESEVESAKRLSAHTELHRRQQMHRELGQMNVRGLLRELDAEKTAASLTLSKSLAAQLELESDDEDDERSKLRKRRQRKERLLKKLDEQEAREKSAAKNKQLWVDKYAPRGYGDLLSPEQINREVLEWLKGWDTCVFGEKKSAAGSAGDTHDHMRTLDAQLMHSKVMSPGKKKKAVPLVSADGLADIRPAQRVLLLCGPPGLGKTTLAHILAKQAGYHPFEINASDDRNPGVLESKIRAATEMQSVSFGSEHVSKPNCIILDEIDGVGGEGGEMGSIQMLVKIVMAEGRKGKKIDEANEGGDDGNDSGSDGEQDADASSPVVSRKSKRGDGPKKSPLQPLRRPIICICNDQFAAALRPLRAIARIFEFTTAPKAKFVDRLKFITSKEGMECDPRTLGALADVVDMDIRSALNTLQFVHSKGQRLTAATLNGVAIGRKDVEKSRFAIWDSVFCDRETKKDHLLQFRDMRETERHNARGSMVSLADAKTRELQGMLSDAGDMDKIIEGIFHNYPTIPYPDPNFMKTVDCADWLAYADLLDHRIQSEVEMSLTQYTPYAAIGIHHLTARPRKVMLEAPNVFYHAWVESQRNTNIVRSFLSPTNSLTLDGVSANSTVMDVLPFVLDILHPTIRPVNYNMLTPKEKGEMSNLIDTMLSLSMTYRPEVQSAFASSSASVAWNSRPSDHATILYKLEPAIDLVSTWTNPLDSSSGAKFGTDRQLGLHSGVKSTFGSRPAPSAVQPFRIDKRDINMPGKVKQMVMRELEFEAMRRTEARIADKNANAAIEAGNANGQPPQSPAPVSLISPAVQKLLDRTKQDMRVDVEKKRARVGSADSPAGKPSSLVPIDDESPATKRAKTSASLNFLTAHADAAKKKRRPAPNAKLQLNGLKTEKETKETSDAKEPEPTLPACAAVLSRFTHPLHFKYNEGCTNAVRRTVNVEHFLPL